MEERPSFAQVNQLPPLLQSEISRFVGPFAVFSRSGSARLTLFERSIRGVLTVTEIIVLFCFLTGVRKQTAPIFVHATGQI